MQAWGAYNLIMNTTDLITILGNISQSLYPVQELVSGFAYLLGIAMIITALKKLRQMGSSGGGEKMMAPTAWLIGGVMLLFLPSSMKVFSGTVFGPDNILSYGHYNQYDIHHIISLFIKTAGVIWFIRGTVLLVHSSQPGTKFGGKGLLFIIAGILAMNFEATGSILNHLMDYISTATTFVKTKTGY